MRSRSVPGCHSRIFRPANHRRSSPRSCSLPPRWAAATRRPTMADAMTPSYIVVNPDGTIGADFSGHVHAAGLDLDEADLIASVQHGVNWLDAGRNVVEGIYGVEL